MENLRTPIGRFKFYGHMSSARQSQAGLPKAPKLYENNCSNNLSFLILQKIQNATQITFALLHQYKMEGVPCIQILITDYDKNSH